MASNPELVVIVGPTASGKSDLAVKLAKKLDGEIVSADSRQVYKGLDIGSGKITRKEMRGVRHHLLDVASPKRVYTAAHWKQAAEKAVREIRKRGKIPVIVGGTGFYIDSLLYDAPLPEVKPDPKLRARFHQRSAPDLFEELHKKDPERAANIDRHNKRRLVRALEIIAAKGSVPKPVQKKLKYNVLKIGLNPPPNVLKKKIRGRLLRRMQQGMVREVEKLHRNGLSWKRLEDLGLEYRYVSRYLRGLLTKEEMLRQLATEIWHYARRQMTWWRRDKDMHWVTPAKALNFLLKRK